MTGVSTGKVTISGAGAIIFDAMTGAGIGRVLIVGAGGITFATMTGAGVATTGIRFDLILGPGGRGTINPDLRIDNLAGFRDDYNSGGILQYETDKRENLITDVRMENEA